MSYIKRNKQKVFLAVQDYPFSSYQDFLEWRKHRLMSREHKRLPEVKKALHMLRARLKKKRRPRFIITASNTHAAGIGITVKSAYYSWKEQVKVVRRLDAHPAYTNARIGNLALVGGAHVLGNAIINFHHHRIIQKGAKPRYPLTSKLHVGVEIECISTLTRLQAVTALQGYQKYVSVVDDGSLRVTSNHYYQHEVRVVAPLTEIEQVLQGVCALLGKGERSVTNKSCGTHVHLDCRARDPQAVFNNLRACQKLLYSLIPYERRDNHFIRPLPTKKFKVALQSNRYYGINTASLRKHKTIEVRLLDGTLDPTLILHWITLLEYIANAPPITGNVRSIWQLRKIIALPDDLCDFFHDRARDMAKEGKITEQTYTPINVQTGALERAFTTLPTAPPISTYPPTTGLLANIGTSVRTTITDVSTALLRTFGGRGVTVDEGNE